MKHKMAAGESRTLPVCSKSHISYILIILIIKLCFEEFLEPIFFWTMKIHQNKQNTNKQIMSDRFKEPRWYVPTQRPP